MTWAPLLLADPSPCLRWLVLRHLFHLPADHSEVLELDGLRQDDPLVASLVFPQGADGAWQPGVLSASWGRGYPLLSTAYALSRLGYLGFGPEHPAVARGAAYLFSQQNPDGSWPISIYSKDVEEDRGYDLISLQTSFPLRGLAMCGYAANPQSERAYEWLLAQRLPDGAWPTGIASGVYGRVAGYRRLPHSRWGCRTNTTAAVLCLALHPARRSSPEARRALDLLLGRETRESAPLGFEVARLLGAEPLHGFFTYFARFDLALMLDLCARLGIGLDDERLAGLLDFVLSLKGPFGLWDYSPNPQVSRWVTFDLLRSIAALDPESDWISLEPRTPFQPYLRRKKSFRTRQAFSQFCFSKSLTDLLKEPVRPVPFVGTNLG